MICEFYVFCSFFFCLICVDCVSSLFFEVLLTNEIKVTFTEHVPLLYVAKCWLNRGPISLQQQYFELNTGTTVSYSEISMFEIHSKPERVANHYTD